MANITPTDEKTFRDLLTNDPEIQAVIKSVWGDTPVDQRIAMAKTPKNLADANDRASKQISAILAKRGIQLPNHTFINPRTQSLEGMHGWAGLPTGAKVAIIAGLAATGVGAAAAAGAFGGAAAAGGAAGAGSGAGAAGAAVPSIATTSGLGSMAGIGTTVGAAGTALPAAGALGAAGASAVPSIAASSGLGSTAGIGTSVGAGGGIGAGTGATGAVSGGSTLAKMVGGGGSDTLPSTPISGSSSLPYASSGNMNVPSVTASDPSFWSKFKDAAVNYGKSQLTGKGLQTAGNVIGALSQTQASNRGTKLDAQMEADKMRLAAAQNQRSEDSYLWKMLQATDYVKNGGQPKKDNYSASGFKLPSFNIGPAPISDAMKANASTLEGQLKDRLNNPLKLENYDQQMDPSKTESVMDWLGPIVSGVGAATDQSGQYPIPGMTTRTGPIQNKLGGR